MKQIYKYPRTRHIEGSRLQPGDEDLKAVPFSRIKDKHLIIEEKVDGANCAISFSEKGNLLLQSRGHYLTGGKREKHFNLFKTWANTHVANLKKLLSTNYIMYGEWLYAKHTVYYDQLPHYFMEFDIYDSQKGNFLSTPRRKEMLSGYPFINSVRVLSEGPIKKLKTLTNFIENSNFIGTHFKKNLYAQCQKEDLDPERTFRETDLSGLMEGLYIKVENKDIILERYKWIRYNFLTTVVQSGSHWLNRPIIPNRLSDGVDIFNA